MTKTTQAKNAVWTSPELVKLGKLQDVAPGAPGVTEGSSGKS